MAAKLKQVKDELVRRRHLRRQATRPRLGCPPEAVVEWGSWLWPYGCPGQLLASAQRAYRGPRLRSAR
jgi:hypothetical protein